MRKVFFLFFFSLVYTVFIFLFLAELIPEKNFFPYQDIALEYASERWARFANFDGVHYISIARSGYSQYEQAFFPLYPILIKGFSYLFAGNFFVAGIFISWVSFLAGLYIWYLFLKRFRKKSFFWILVLWVFFPTGFYFFALYTESLFFLIFGLVLYSLHRRHLKILYPSLFFLSLARVIGVLAGLLVIFHPKLKIHEKILGLIFSVLGLGVYSIYLYQTTGDPFFFFTAQDVFVERSTRLILLPQVYYRYLRIFLTADFSFAYVVALLEFFIFNLVFLFLLYQGWRRKLYIFWKGLSLEKGIYYFSLISFVLPTLTGTLNSIPRYALFAPYFFIYLPESLPLRWRRVVLFLSFFGYSIFAIFFARGYFVS